MLGVRERKIDMNNNYSDLDFIENFKVFGGANQDVD